MENLPQPDTVEGAINAVHQSGSRTLVVGITNLVDDSTLKLLSSPPKLVHRLMLRNYNHALYSEILMIHVTSSCDVASTLSRALDEHSRIV